MQSGILRAHNSNVVNRVGKDSPVQHRMLVPMSEATIQVFLRTASLRRQLCHFRMQLALVGNGHCVLRSNKGWLAAVLGFLFEDFGVEYAALLKNVFRPAFFACCRGMSLHIFAATLAFLLCWGSREVSRITCKPRTKSGQGPQRGGAGAEHSRVAGCTARVQRA